MKDKTKKKMVAEFGKFFPPTTCFNCTGTGKVKDDYITRFLGSSKWTYKKCLQCRGTGKNLYHCATCDELINAGLWCSNQKCKMFNIKVAIIEEEELPYIIK